MVCWTVHSPKCPCLILWIYEYIILYDKVEFADVIKIRISIWGDYSELSRWAQSNHKSLYKEEDRRVRIRKYVIMKTGWSGMLLKQQTGPWAKGCRELRRWKKQGNGFCPMKFLWTSDLQNCKIYICVVLCNQVVICYSTIGN